MPDLEEIVENRPASVGDGSRHEDDRGSSRWNSLKQKQLKDWWGSESTAWREESDIGRKRDVLTTDPENHQAQFYKDYRKVAEEYDKEYLRRSGEDLNTTLIFAGLLSILTSAFIIELGSQLQPDPNNETTNLLRVLIYKIDNTTFGNDPPALPQWAGPPRTIVHVQAILFACLATSLLSALLAMLGRQWLNRYGSSDKRGLTIECSQNRQRKLDGIVAWYFNPVMESPPLMLQATLLLLGCALSLYLWEINIAIASVVLGITSFGLLFYFLIVIAGIVSESCPYQTPVSRILRYLAQQVCRLLSSTASTFRNTIGKSEVIETVTTNAKIYEPWWSGDKLVPFLRDVFFEIFPASVTDAYRLGQATMRALSILPIGAYRLFRRVLHGTSPPLERVLDRQTATLDLRCISWTLRTSLENTIRQSSLKHLVTIPELTDLEPTIVINCFDAFIGCVSLRNHKVIIPQGLEQLAAVSAGCFFRTFHHISVMDPTSSVLTYIRSHYNRVFPPTVDFKDLTFRHTMTMTHALVTQRWSAHHTGWDDDRPSGQEHTSFARYMVGAARVGYQQALPTEVPRWILHFVLDSLSLHPLPPASVVADCLTIAAIDLDCDVSNIMVLEDSVRIGSISSVIIRNLEKIAIPTGPDSILSERRALAALFPYAIRLEQDGQKSMANAILRAWTSNSMKSVWDRIGPHIVRLLGKSSTPSLHHAIPLIFPKIPWDDGLRDGNTVMGWDSAASKDPYTEKAGQDVVNLLLQIAHTESLLPHIPIDVWTWLKKRPSLPPVCQGRLRGTTPDIVRHIRGLGDIEILKSYFLVVWSEWDSIYPFGLSEMDISIREDFDGVEMKRHRRDLIERLDHILERLEYFEQRSPLHKNRAQRRKEQYGKLKGVLLEVDRSQ